MLPEDYEPEFWKILKTPTERLNKDKDIIARLDKLEELINHWIKQRKEIQSK